MALVNLLIAPITGYTATERAAALSAELWNICRPLQVRDPAKDTNALFGWVTHPATGECVLQAYTDHVIRVHPDNNLSTLIALMPNLPLQVQAGLVALIENSQTITFGQLLTGQEDILTDAQLEADGWFNPIIEL